MIEMETRPTTCIEAGIPVLDYKTYNTDRVLFLPSKDGDKDVMITGKLDIPQSLGHRGGAGALPVLQPAQQQVLPHQRERGLWVGAGLRVGRGPGGGALTVACPSVHPHPGEPAGVLGPRQGSTASLLTGRCTGS